MGKYKDNTIQIPFKYTVEELKSTPCMFYYTIKPCNMTDYMIHSAVTRLQYRDDPDSHFFQYEISDDEATAWMYTFIDVLEGRVNKRLLLEANEGQSSQNEDEIEGIRRRRGSLNPEVHYLNAEIRNQMLQRMAQQMNIRNEQGIQFLYSIDMPDNI